MDSTSVFIATIVFSIINQVVCVALLNELFPFGIKNYMIKVILPCLILFVSIPLLPFVAHRILPEGFVRLLLVGLVDMLVGLVLAYWVILNKPERTYAINLILKRQK